MNDVSKLIRPFAILLIITALVSVNAKAAPDLKNIIIISVDTLRADHLGCYGYPVNTSPAVDAFARDGVLFAGCYTPIPLTSPAFTTMLTSLPPHKHGAKRNGLSIFNKINTLPYYLKRFGYRSAAVISNWTLRKRLSGLDKDFTVYHQVLNKKRWLGIKDEEGTAPRVNEKAIEWLENNRKKRFFVWVHYTEPHAPYISHKGFSFDYTDVPTSTYPPGTRMKKIEKYDSEIAFTDSHIGKLIEKIKELGLYDDSLIIFLGDHGESFGEHNYFRHGKKLYNSTLHVPMIVKLPGNRLKGTVRKENVSLMDIAPTIASVLNMPRFPKMEGLALFDKGSDLVNRELLLETYGGKVRLRRRGKKHQMKIKPIKYAILKGPRKVIYNVKAKTFETYDLSKDFFETENIFVRLTMGGKEVKERLLKTVALVNEFIKLSRKHRLHDPTISQEDLEKLKSMGYLD